MFNNWCFCAKACISENYALFLPAKGGDLKANGTQWGWQIPRFGTSGLQIRWNGELVFQYGETMGELMKDGINPGMPAYQPFKYIDEYSP